MKVWNYILPAVIICIMLTIVNLFYGKLYSIRKENVEIRGHIKYESNQFYSQLKKGYTSDKVLRQGKIPIKKLETDSVMRQDKWTILLTVNNAFFDVFKIWWWHFLKRGIHVKVNITVIAEDYIVFDKLMKYCTNDSVTVVKSWILNLPENLEFKTPKYMKLVSTRPVYILRYLEERKNVLYTDIDTVWLQNPFPFFSGNFDMWVQTEVIGKQICAGFMAIKSNQKTVELMKRWISVLKSKLQLNQPALMAVVRTSNVNISYLDERKFVGSDQFTQMSPDQRSQVVMLHATYCKGHDQKYDCYKKWNLWRTI